MIVFSLKCTGGHVFEAWFRDSATYDAQAQAGEITCPVCGDNGISKAPMAPRILKRSRRSSSAEEQAAREHADGRTPSSVAVQDRAFQLKGELLRHLAELRRKVEETCDYVGDRFAEEARRIHYGEVEPRGIYGEATEAETEALREEGIDFHRTPWVSTPNS